MSCRFKHVYLPEIEKNFKDENKSINDLKEQVTKSKSSTANFRNIQLNRKRRASVLSNQIDPCIMQYKDM